MIKISGNHKMSKIWSNKKQRAEISSLKCTEFKNAEVRLVLDFWKKTELLKLLFLVLMSLS